MSYIAQMTKKHWDFFPYQCLQHERRSRKPQPRSLVMVSEITAQVQSSSGVARWARMLCRELPRVVGWKRSGVQATVIM